LRGEIARTHADLIMDVAATVQTEAFQQSQPVPAYTEIFRYSLDEVEQALLKALGTAAGWQQGAQQDPARSLNIPAQSLTATDGTKIAFEDAFLAKADGAVPSLHPAQINGGFMPKPQQGAKKFISLDCLNGHKVTP